MSAHPESSPAVPASPVRDRSALVLDLFERYYDRVYLFARRSVDASAAEDIAQEVFARLLKAADLERKTLTASYLIKIADNLIKRRYQRRKKLEACVEAVALGGAAGRDTGREHRAGAAGDEVGDEKQRVSHALKHLAPAEQDTVRMIVCGGLSYSQAAEALGARVTSVNNWKHRGIQRLKKHATECSRDGRVAPGRDAG